MNLTHSLKFKQTNNDQHDEYLDIIVDLLVLEKTFVLSFDIVVANN
jgi:hypothetical protein